MEGAPDKRLEEELTQLEQEGTLGTQGISSDSELSEPVIDLEDAPLHHSVFGPNRYGDFYS